MRWNWRVSANSIHANIATSAQRRSVSVAAVALSETQASTRESLAASQAIHISVEKSDIRGAYHIFNSIHNSQLIGIARSTNDAGLLRQLGPYAVDFSLSEPHAIPSRLSAHVLIHALLRKGYVYRAQEACRWMIQNGLPIHTRTLEAVVGALATAQSPVVEGLKMLYDKAAAHLDHSPILQPRPSNPNLIAIHNLLEEARASRQHRGDRLFKILLGTCLLQGEIIFATFIFASAITLYEARVEAAAEDAAGTHQAQAEDGRQRQLHTTRDILTDVEPYPSHISMDDILRAISLQLEKPQDNPEFKLGLQALANLAMLLDLRQLPYNHIATLLRVMYSCPSNTHTVWVFDTSGNPQRVNSTIYFRDVIDRLINSLHTRRPRQDKKQHPSSHFLPPLNTHSCNALLHYSLRVRKSTALANSVLNHFADRRHPLAPNLVTYNILISASTHSKRLDIAESTTLLLQDMAHMQKLGVQPAQRSVVLGMLGLQPGKAKAQPVTLHVRQTRLSKASPQTTTATIKYLADSRQYGAIVDTAGEMFPRLMDNREASFATQDDLNACIASHVDAASNAGPIVLTALMSGLMRGGYIGLAERIWELALLAEKRSWTRKNGQPWRLDAQAFTTMVSGYEDEVRRRRQKSGKDVNDHAREVWRLKGMAWKIYCLFMDGDLNAQADALGVKTPHPRPTAWFFDKALQLNVPRGLQDRKTDWLGLLRDEMHRGVDAERAGMRCVNGLQRERTIRVVVDMVREGMQVPGAAQYFIRQEVQSP
ncbi:hypothetical protein CYLTODRAFT_30469 [Cylindrobasidium torrendii FP15055 ss-10]|uniref:Uncharacterized protein n=1 Tax=Cylindrobasidium torrendii FP15055 ss-10 TaxID=1314674 RepID=A0A0D7B8G6_9AGAR|nr:hypothetical protein CYLTODRAFT_30469 [Cylindrobasidium torrendii FP15055 ss-10]